MSPNSIYSSNTSSGSSLGSSDSSKVAYKRLSPALKVIITIAVITSLFAIWQYLQLQRVKSNLNSAQATINKVIDGSGISLDGTKITAACGWFRACRSF